MKIKLTDIQSFARRIGKEFKPKQIILFGSYAYGKPSRDSDVDLMVVMPYEGHPSDVAIKIRNGIPAPFALDLLVYSPSELRHRYRIEDWFVRDVVEKGKVLYETRHA